MFWDKGYAPSANIEALLEKENVTLGEFLDEDDIIQECKTYKKNLVNYFTNPDIIKQMVTLVTTEPSEELPITQRYRHANMASEILSLGIPSLDKKLLSDTDTLNQLYSYLENEPPLNPLLSSFFSKTFSMLFIKKAEQDWFLYQQLCLQLLEYLKAKKNFLDLICKHFETPIIPDLVMQMMKEIEGGKLKRNLYEWLTEDKLVERLIVILRNPQETDKHANVAEFFCDLIQQGRQMRQTEQENDSFEPAFTGSNPVLKVIESTETIEALLNVILEPNALESAIISGISVVLMIIKPISFDDDPISGRQLYLQNRERENHLQMQETVINVLSPRLIEFVSLLKNPPPKPNIETSACLLQPPFGKTRLQICRIFTALLETKHETVLEAICATDYFELMLDFFKQYCWNNFLHSELEKAVNIIFYNNLSTGNFNSTNGSDNSYDKHVASDNNILNFFMKTGDDIHLEYVKNSEKRAVGGDDNSFCDANIITHQTIEDESEMSTEKQSNPEKSIEKSITNTKEEVKKQQEELKQQVNNDGDDVPMTEPYDANKENIPVKEAEAKDNELDKAKVPANAPPTEIQKHLIVHCRLISKLIEFWTHNKESESVEGGRRLGYMGHLINILKSITNSINESEHIGALVESNLNDETELKLWQSMVNPETGDFSKALITQSKQLANYNPNDDVGQEEVPEEYKDMFEEISRSFWAKFNDYSQVLLDVPIQSEYGRNSDDFDEDEDDDNSAAGSSVFGHGHGLFAKNSLTLSNLAVNSSGNPWDAEDPFTEYGSGNNDDDGGLTNATTTGWGADFGSDNFADFDAHFNSFTNDLGIEFAASSEKQQEEEQQQQQLIKETNLSEEDNNKYELYIDSDRSQNMEGHHTLSEKASNFNMLSCDLNKGVTAAQGFDNNANVEKGKYVKDTILEATNIIPTSLPTTTSATLASRLQSVLLDGEEDYEDDEGMWTKPLGGNSSDHIREEQKCDNFAYSDEKQNTVMLTNGPSNSSEDDILNESDKQEPTSASTLEQNTTTKANTMSIQTATATI